MTKEEVVEFEKAWGYDEIMTLFNRYDFNEEDFDIEEEDFNIRDCTSEFGHAPDEWKKKPSTVDISDEKLRKQIFGKLA